MTSPGIESANFRLVRKFYTATGRPSRPGCWELRQEVTSQWLQLRGGGLCTVNTPLLYLIYTHPKILVSVVGSTEFAEERGSIVA
jgi:hypothetical protein